MTKIKLSINYRLITSNQKSHLSKNQILMYKKQNKQNN